MAKRRTIIARRMKRALPGRYPDWIIVGAMKAGTTTLHTALHRAPRTIEPAAGEVHFFDVNFRRGLDWYRRHFAQLPGTKTGESSPYYLFHPDAARRIASVLPDVRIVALLRDPVERAYSHWAHNVRAGRELLSFEDALDAEAGRVSGTNPDHRESPYRHFSYVGRGLYADQLERLYEAFPPDRVHVVCSEELFEDPRTFVADTCRWLGLREPAGDIAWRNRVMRRNEMSPEVRSRLAARYAESNARVARLLGREFPAWSRP